MAEVNKAQTWRDQMHPASFRGVPFLVETESAPVGRRVQLHEYPQRDRPLVEDMGAQTRRFKFTALVAGDDVFFQRDNLLHALDTPGSGELVHPWFGRLQVTAGDGCSVSHGRREGGVVYFELDFIEAGEKGYPVGVPNSAGQLEEKSESLLDSAISRYKKAMALVNKVRVSAQALQNGIAGIQMAIQSEFAQLVGAVTSVQALADMLVNAPDNFASMIEAQFSGLFDWSRWSGSEDDGEYPGYVSATRSIAGLTSAASAINAEPAPGGGAATVAVVAAARDLMRDALLTKALTVAAQMSVVKAPAPLPGVPTIDQQVAVPIERPEVPVADEVIVLRDALSEAIWEASLSAPHEHFEVLQAARKQVCNHLTQVAQAGVRLIDVQPKESLPAVVLAYRQYGDASRAAEIVTRNKVVHPGFLPIATLRCAQE